MDTITRAPRFHAYWEHEIGKTILIISREVWEGLDFTKRTNIEININKTPLSRLSENRNFLVGIASETPSGSAEIRIYRNDPGDPKPINVDYYDVYENFPDPNHLEEMATNADTEIDTNFRTYLEENVFLVKRNKDDNHWIKNMPEEIHAIIQISKKIKLHNPEIQNNKTDDILFT